MALAIPERARVGQCDRCGAQEVERFRNKVIVRVRDWSRDDARAYKDVVLGYALCLSCYEAVRQGG